MEDSISTQSTLTGVLDHQGGNCINLTFQRSGHGNDETGNIASNNTGSLQNFMSGVPIFSEDIELSGSRNSGQEAELRNVNMTASRDQFSNNEIVRDVSKETGTSVSSIMASPLLRVDSTGNNGNMSVFQQQLIQTQKMCVEQQRKMNSIAASVDKLQKSVDKWKREDSFDDRPSSSRNSNNNRFLHVLSDSAVEEQSSDPEQDKGSESGELSSSDESVQGHTSSKKRKFSSPEERKKDKLKSLSKTFGKDSEFDPPIDSDLAKSVNKGLSSDLDHKSDTVKTLLNKYIRPENCEYLNVPRVARSIWTSRETAKNLKDSDKLLQRTQQYLTKGLVPLVGIMNKTFKQNTEESDEIFDLAVDAFTLLAYSHKDLSCQRKRLLMPAISSKFKALCGDSSSITAEQLFGNNLSEQIKEIEESGKISNKIVFKSQKKGGKYEQKHYDSYGSNKFGDKQSSYKSSFLSRKGPRYQNSRKNHNKKGNSGRNHK